MKPYEKEQQQCFTMCKKVVLWVPDQVIMIVVITGFEWYAVCFCLVIPYTIPNNLALQLQIYFSVCNSVDHFSKLYTYFDFRMPHPF